MSDNNMTHHIANYRKVFIFLLIGTALTVWASYVEFNVQNSITNTWVRDVYSKRQFSIPNYLTPRIFNLNLEFKF